MAAYTKVNLKEVEDMAPKFGFAPDLESRFARKALELEKSGLSYFKVAPDFRVPFGHTHSEQEEVYLVIAGNARVKLDDEVVDLSTWDAIRIPPGTHARHGGRLRGRRDPRVRRAEHGEQGRRDGPGLVERLSGYAA